MPACSNCVNRGEITACCYVSRKPESRVKPQQSLDLSEPVQRKIDHLERLVHTLLKNHQYTQGQIDTPSSYIDAENDENDIPVDTDKSDLEHYAEPGSTNRRTTTGLVNLNDAIKISADYKQSLSVDEAHWALLLNEVRDATCSLLFLTKQTDW